ncbi:pentapeptide repeat-containing protein [Fortiea sp. LEGE XX443]|uniref:WD40 domain-containing protein n=1 Tax=Fortiea sp. LEGE XX443 TaxID=1828611 RepID=UPI00351C9B31
MTKTVVEIDLAGYSDIVKSMQQDYDVDAVPYLNKNIQRFIDDSLKEIDNSKYIVQDKKGDNRVIFFDHANDAYKFAETVHRKTKLYNVSTNKKFAKRLFRIGAATGKFVMNYDGENFTGYDIITAYRLEAKAEPGKCFIVDVETFNSLSRELQDKFDDEKTVFGKKRTTVCGENVCDEKEEEFQARSCKIIYDNLLECFEKLNKEQKQLVYQIGLEGLEYDDNLSEESKNNVEKLVEQELIIKQEYDSRTRFILANNFNNFFQEIIVKIIVEEISTKKLDILKKYSILKILTRKDVHKLLQEKLSTIPQAQDDNSMLGEYIYNIIHTWQNTPNLPQLSDNYAAGNLLNLLLQFDLKTDFSYSNLSNISIWNADLTKATLTGVDFTKSNLKNSIFSQPLGCIHSIAFDADGDYFATGDAHGSIRVHNAKTLELCIFHNERNSPIWSVAFGKNKQHERMLAWGAEDGSVKLYKITSTDNKMKLSLIDSLDVTTRILSVVFSPDGYTLANGGDGNNAIHFLKINNDYHPKGTLDTSDVSCMVFINNDCIASGSQDGYIRLGYIEQANHRQDFSQKVHQGVVRCIAFYGKKEEERRILVSGGEDGKLKMLDLTKHPLHPEDIKFETEISQVRTIAFSQDGNILAVGCIDNNANGQSEHKIRLWSFSNREWIGQPLEGHKYSIRSLVFSPQPSNSQLLVSGGDGCTVNFWQKENEIWRGEEKLKGYANRIWSVALSRDGKTFACGGEDNKIHLWNYHERTHIPLQTLTEHTNWVWSVAFSPNADILASGCEDNKIYLWGLQEGKWQPIRELVGNSEVKGHDKRVRGVVFHPDGYNLISAGNDNRIILWDITDLNRPQILPGFTEHNDRVLSVAFSPDGNYLVSSSRDQNIYLIEVETHHQPYSLGNHYLLGNHTDSHKDQVHSIAFSPDSNLLVSGGFDKKLKLWDVKSRKLIRTWDGYQKILSVAFHPKKQPKKLIVASAGHNHIIQLWDIDDPNNVKLIKTFKGHKRAVESIVFTPDGKQLISCSQDQTIKFWEVGGKLNISIHTIELGKPYQGMNIYGLDGLDSAQISALEELGALKLGLKHENEK